MTDDSASFNLEAIRLPQQTPSSSPDTETTEEIESLESAHKRAIIAGLRQDIGERKIYARRIFILICAWLGAVFLVLVGQGIGYHFSLSQTIILALIGSTTVDVLGLFYIVAHYLFPTRPPSTHT